MKRKAMSTKKCLPTSTQSHSPGLSVLLVAFAFVSVSGACVVVAATTAAVGTCVVVGGWVVVVVGAWVVVVVGAWFVVVVGACVVVGVIVVVGAAVVVVVVVTVGFSLASQLPKATLRESMFTSAIGLSSAQ